MIRYSDEAIIEGLRLRKENIIKFVYREFFPMARHLIVHNSGTDQDAEDVFQDALVIVYKRIIVDEIPTEKEVVLCCALEKCQKFEIKMFCWEFNLMFIILSISVAHVLHYIIHH